MENDTLKKEADKVINVTYMLSGVLEQSFQEMDEILDRLHKRLHHEDRRLINPIRPKTYKISQFKHRITQNSFTF